jgi:pyridoxamine 5'-phosphate oxidase
MSQTDLESDLHAWAADLATLHAHVWQLLTRGVRDRRAAARHPTLATVSIDGKPQARTVVLRAADQARATVDIHTDIHSAKIAELRARPFAALHIWDASAHLQMRLESEVTILTGADVAAIWARVPDVARLSYGCTPVPGVPIASALDYVKVPDQAAFAVLRMQIMSMDIVHLGPNHRRAAYKLADQWAGQWLVP